MGENEHLRPVRLFLLTVSSQYQDQRYAYSPYQAPIVYYRQPIHPLYPHFTPAQANNINLPADFENVEPELGGSVGHLGNYPTGATKTFLNSNLNWVIKPVGLTTAVYSIGNIPITLIQTTVG